MLREALTVSYRPSAMASLPISNSLDSRTSIFDTQRRLWIVASQWSESSELDRTTGLSTDERWLRIVCSSLLSEKASNLTPPSLVASYVASTSKKSAIARASWTWSFRRFLFTQGLYITQSFGLHFLWLVIRPTRIAFGYCSQFIQRRGSFTWRSFSCRQIGEPCPSRNTYRSSS